MTNLLIAIMSVVLLVVGFSMVTNVKAVAAGHNSLSQALSQK